MTLDRRRKANLLYKAAGRLQSQAYEVLKTSEAFMDTPACNKKKQQIYRHPKSQPLKKNLYL